MTLFEYLTIAFGLLYSISALRLVGGLPAATAPDRRYWVHLLLTLALLLLIASGFWTFWSLRDVVWTFLGFLLSLMVVAALYYCAAVLVPENPGQVTSWRAHYFAVRRRWYAGFMLWAVAIALNASVNLGMSLTHPLRGVQLVALGVGTVGVASSSPRVHAGLVLLFAVLVVGFSLSIGLNPGWLVQS